MSIDSLKYNRILLPIALTKVMSSSSVKNFFAEIKNCNLKLVRNKTNDYLSFNLKNIKNEFCFFNTNLSGKKINIIKRLYAKDSKCE